MNKIRIVHVITRFVPGGAQKIVQSLLEGLSPDRYECILVTGSEDLCSREVLAALESRKIQIMILPHLVRQIAPLSDCLAILSLYRFLKKTQPEIVHTHTSKAGIIGRIAARLAGVSTIVHTPHGHIYLPESRIEGVPGPSIFLKAILAVEKWCGTWTSKIIALTNAEREETIRLGLGREGQVVTIHNAIDPGELQSQAISKQASRKKYGIPEEAYVVGSVGRFSQVKGHRDFLKAAELLLQQKGVRPICFVLAGEGPEKQVLQAWVNEQGLGDCVRMPGYIEKVGEILPAMDLFVLPSLYEGFGISILEAWAFKLPVIATRVGGVTEIVQENQEGRLVLRHNPEAMAAAITEMMADRGMAARFGEAGYQKLMRLFQVGQMVEAHNVLYQTLGGPQ